MSTSTFGDTPAPPLLPTETEIYILPDGCVVIADLPVELAAMAPRLGVVIPCAMTLDGCAEPDERTT